MKYHVLTLFPEMIEQGLSTSIMGRAMEQGYVSLNAINIRDYTTNKHNKVDDYPYGGGAGMVMQAQPIYDAWKSVTDDGKKKIRAIYLNPQGKVFNQTMAKEFAREEELIFLCGHYEGVDERVLDTIITDHVSIGDYVLTGGELPAMVMIDAISRMVPGVLSNEASGEGETFEGSLLEYPQYTRPEVWKGMEVPKVLMSGDHKKVEEWRHMKSVERTHQNRPDLLEEAELSREDVLSILEKTKE